LKKLKVSISKSIEFLFKHITIIIIAKTISKLSPDIKSKTLIQKAKAFDFKKLTLVKNTPGLSCFIC
jgi:hypothetical protein